MDKIKAVWLKLEDYWAKFFGFVGAHPKTCAIIIAALVVALVVKP